MANNENLIPFDKRSVREAREFGRKGGKASGETRRRKADFRKTLNLLLTVEIDNEEWTPFLQSVGIDSTLESAVNAAMIKKALAGNVKAYEAIAKYSGQSDTSDQESREKELQIQKLQAELEKQKLENEQLKGILDADKEEVQDDGFLEALNGSAAGDWNEEEPEEDI